MSKTSLGELMTIRDILMGEIIEEYNARFEAVEQELKAQKAALDAKEAALNERIAALDQLLHGQLDDTHTHFTTKMAEDRHALGALFLSLGQQLKA